MNITMHKSNVVTVRQDDPMFKMNDGFTIYPRAGFHILPECPQQYKQMIGACIDNGWLKPVAYMRDYEQTFALLKND